MVIEVGALSGRERRAVVRAAGASHGVRFFTAAGELANCGHGTIAAQAVVPERGAE